MSSGLEKALQRAGVAEKRVAQLEDELSRKSTDLANKVIYSEFLESFFHKYIFLAESR